MKLKIVILVATMFLTTSLSAQHVIPRFGTAPNQNRTYTSVSLGIKNITDTLGATPDTVIIGGGSYDENCFTRNYVLTLKDSCVIAFGNASTSWFGDNMTFVIQNGSVSGWVKFLGYSGLSSLWSMTGGTTKISPTASHSYILSFYFDGAHWLQRTGAQD